MEKRLTEARYKALKTILAAGGWTEDRCHNGRTTRGSLNKTLVHGMHAAGLLSYSRAFGYQPTYAACVSVQAEDNRRAYEALRREPPRP